MRLTFHGEDKLRPKESTLLQMPSVSRTALIRTDASTELGFTLPHKPSPASAKDRPSGVSGTPPDAASGSDLSALPPPAALHAAPRAGWGRTRPGARLLRPEPETTGDGRRGPRPLPLLDLAARVAFRTAASPRRPRGCKQPPGRARAEADWPPTPEALADLERCFRICFLMSPAMVPRQEASHSFRVSHCLLSSWPPPRCPD